MYTKLVPETVHYISLTLKSIWNHLNHLFGIIYKSIFCQLEHHIQLLVHHKTINIRGNFI